MFNLGYGQSSENGLSHMPALLHHAWNSLPDELQEAPTFNSFKTHLLALLLGFS